MSDELRQQIEEFYLPRQLVDAILEFGRIPEDSQEAEVGIGFIDIADYSFLSKFLSPKENQLVLNGLYTAFNSVLRRHGGYLNKIEGDSLMFHYGGLIDPTVRRTDDPEAIRNHIARQLFFTCVEMQRVCVQFNEADARFLDTDASAEDLAALRQAFEIIARLRRDSELSSSMNAMFQVRIRVGANLGEVTIGNFGPQGARHWDVIGMPVINAKRMETTAPVGGLRISKAYFEILTQLGVADEYYERFKAEAKAANSRYANITQEELFLQRRVVVRDKQNASFETYSIQVNPALPEQIAAQVRDLLARGSVGADIAVDLLRYYRGNRYVVDAVEETLVNQGVPLRYAYAYEAMYPNRFKRLLHKYAGSTEAVEKELSAQYSLFELMQQLGRYQDLIKHDTAFETVPVHFSTYDRYMALIKNQREHLYDVVKVDIAQRTYFFNVVFPLVFESIRAAILDYQSALEDLELLSG